MVLINILLVMVVAYLGGGLIFSVPFILKGVTKIDEGAENSGWGFRIIIIPGTIVFWPYLLKRWRKAKNKITND
jgi:hypothetical protein